MVEVGCGRGVALGLLADAGVPVLHGVDRSATAVAAARARLEDRTVLHHAALADLRLDVEFDVVLAVNVNVFWTADPARELAAVRRCLRPGGRLHLVYESPGEPELLVARVRERLSPHGLRPHVEVQRRDGRGPLVRLRCDRPAAAPEGLGTVRSP